MSGLVWDGEVPPSEKLSEPSTHRYRRKVINTLDTYGNALRSHPGMRPKSFSGAITASIFMSVCAGFVLFSIYKIVIPEERNEIEGPPITYLPTRNSMFNPVTLMNVDCSVTFFEEEAPSIQNIILNDIDGYVLNRTSTDTKINVTRSFEASYVIPLSTQSELLNEFQPPGGMNVTMNLLEVLEQQLPLKFRNTRDYLDSKCLLGDSSFFDHKIVVFTRWEPSEIQRLYEGQARMSLFNAGDLDLWLKNSSRVESDLYITGSRIDRHMSSDEKIVNVMEMNDWWDKKNIPSTVSKDDMHVWLQWYLDIQYSNAESFFFTDDFCDSENLHSMYQDGKYSFLEPFGPDATAIDVVVSDLKFLELYEKVPYKLLADGIDGREVLIVTDAEVTNATQGRIHLTVERTSHLDYSHEFWPPYDYFDRNAPSEWSCNELLYRDGACDCECGVMDPDCLDEDAQLRRCRPGQRCSFRAFCLDPADLKKNLVTLPCHKIWRSKDQVLLGFNQEYEHDKVCPWDDIYGFKPQLWAGSYLCNTRAKATVDGQRNKDIVLDRSGVVLSGDVIVSAGLGEPPVLTKEEGAVNPISVVFSEGQRNEVFGELVQTSGAGGLPCPGCGPFEMAIRFKFIQTDETRQISYASLVSSPRDNIFKIVVQIFRPDQMFPSHGPFLVHLEYNQSDYEVEISSTLEHSGCELNADGDFLPGAVCMQTLFFPDPLNVATYGHFGVVAMPQWGAASVLEVYPYEDWRDIPVPFQAILTPSSSMGDGSTLEPFTVNVTDVSSDWTCPLDKYGTGDGCDCGCGLYDPDCGYPTPADFGYDVLYCYHSDGSFDTHFRANGFDGYYCSDMDGDDGCVMFAPQSEDPPTEIRLTQRLHLDPSSVLGKVIPKESSVEYGDGAEGPSVVFTRNDVQLYRSIPAPHPPEDGHFGWPVEDRVRETDSFASPELLHVDMAAFLIPDQEPFYSDNETDAMGCLLSKKDFLCIDNFRSGAPTGKYKDDYKIRSYLEGDATCKGFRDLLCADKEEKLSDDSMPATQQLNFTFSTTLTDQFMMTDEGDPEAVDLPDALLTIRRQLVFQFIFGQSDIDVDHDFGASGRAGGDLAKVKRVDKYDVELPSYVERKMFNGRLVFEGKRNVSLPYLVPAAPPEFNFNASIVCDPLATEMVIQEVYGVGPKTPSWKFWAKDEPRQPQFWNVNKDKRMAQCRKLMKTLSFDLSGIKVGQGNSITLTPGYEVVLTVFLRVIPVWHRGQLNRDDVEEWEVDVSSTATSFTELGPASANEMHIAFVLALDPDATVKVKARPFTVLDLMQSIGAAVGIYGIGNTVLAAQQGIGGAYRRRKNRIAKEVKNELNKMGPSWRQMGNFVRESSTGAVSRMRRLTHAPMGGSDESRPPNLDIMGISDASRPSRPPPVVARSSPMHTLEPVRPAKPSEVGSGANTRRGLGSGPGRKRKPKPNLSREMNNVADGGRYRITRGATRANLQPTSEPQL